MTRSIFYIMRVKYLPSPVYPTLHTFSDLYLNFPVPRNMSYHVYLIGAQRTSSGTSCNHPKMWTCCRSSHRKSRSKCLGHYMYRPIGSRCHDHSATLRNLSVMSTIPRPQSRLKTQQSRRHSESGRTHTKENIIWHRLKPVLDVRQCVRRGSERAPCH